ncbi:MAG: mfs-type transporter yxam [Parcubacteria group bacterium LiPW_15]|nr:MAG: mfs-type transporter yxam [Parcubacteria group bacterium LiPW_15]
MNHEARQTIRHYLILKSVSAFGMGLIAATYVVFLRAKGLDLLEINMVNFFFFSTLFVCEIPTGAFADVFGRKASYVISCVLFSAGMFLYAITDTFWGFVLAEVISAVGATFASGAFQAWVIDRLKQQGCDEGVNIVFTRDQQLFSAVSIFSSVIGAYAASVHPSLPWIVGGSTSFLAGILAVFYMKEDGFVRKTFSVAKNVRAMAETVSASVRYARGNRVVRFVLLTGFAQFVAVQAPNMQWQIFFGNLLPSNTYLGFIFAGISIATILGATASPWFIRKIGCAEKSLNLVQIAIGAGIFATALCGSFWPAIAFFMFHEFARGFFSPVKNLHLNNNIPSAERATLISLDSISHHVGGMIGLVASGYVAKHISIGFAWQASGAILVISALLLLNRKR